ncbi:MAG: YhcB family protein, partial [Ostreibacterium sp.]
MNTEWLILNISRGKMMTQETMYITMIAIAIMALLIGFLIGKLVGSSSENSQVAKLAQKELSEYKIAVSKHFGKTADLVDNLTESYKDVFEHLGSSARQLLSEEKVKQHLQSRAKKTVTLTYMAEKTTESNLMEQAQTEIQTENIAEVVKADAQKMAQEIQEKPVETEAATKSDTNKLADEKIETATVKADEINEIQTSAKDDISDKFINKSSDKKITD